MTTLCVLLAISFGALVYIDYKHKNDPDATRKAEEYIQHYKEKYHV